MKIDTSSPMSFLKTMRLGDYETPSDFFLDMHELLDLLNCEKLALQSQLKQKDEEIEKSLSLLEDAYLWIKDGYVPDIDIEDGSYRDWIERYREWLEKHKEVK